MAPLRAPVEGHTSNPPDGGATPVATSVVLWAFLVPFPEVSCRDACEAQEGGEIALRGLRAYEQNARRQGRAKRVAPQGSMSSATLLTTRASPSGHRVVVARARAPCLDRATAAPSRRLGATRRARDGVTTRNRRGKESARCPDVTRDFCLARTRERERESERPDRQSFYTSREVTIGDVGNETNGVDETKGKEKLGTWALWGGNTHHIVGLDADSDDGPISCVLGPVACVLDERTRRAVSARSTTRVSPSVVCQVPYVGLASSDDEVRPLASAPVELAPRGMTKGCPLPPPRPAAAPREPSRCSLSCRAGEPASRAYSHFRMRFAVRFPALHSYVRQHV